MTKYYVVSEEELKTLIATTTAATRANFFSESHWKRDLLEEYKTFADKAEATCRAREVEELGIRVRDKGPENLWVEIKR